MQRKFHVDYDNENDSLFLYRAKSQGSVELNNMILDFDKNKDLVGLEILQASRFLQDMNISDVKIGKRMLDSIIDCRIDIKHQGGFLIIKFFLFFENKQEYAASFSVPSIKESSPLAAEA